MNLTALTATVGVMALPLGVFSVVEGTRLEDKWFGYGLCIIGMLLLAMSMLRVGFEEKQEKEKREAEELKAETSGRRMAGWTPLI